MIWKRLVPTENIAYVHPNQIALYDRPIPYQYSSGFYAYH